MMASPAFRVLSLSARRVLDRLEIELAHHGGQDNGEAAGDLSNTFTSTEFIATQSVLEFGNARRLGLSRSRNGDVRATLNSGRRTFSGSPTNRRG